MMKRKIRMGMVGGGPGAFIGAVHRMAARLDGKIELVAGAFSTSAEKSRAMGEELFLDSARVYPDYQTMFAREAALPADRRIDFVAIVTPNATHFPVAMAALEHGFHVLCDKPMTMTLDEAKALGRKVADTGLEFCLTHNYTAYPMIRQAREMIQAGSLGAIRKVVAEYPQGWLAVNSDGKQAAWRTTPAQAGISCCMGDIGTHAENLAEYVTGLKISELCADLTTFVPGRLLDDDGNVLVRFENGARGVIYASQISVGEANALAIRVYGEKGALEWHQEDPNTLKLKWLDRPVELYRAATPGMNAGPAGLIRLPGGHPEGFIEAFANLYRSFASVLAARLAGETVTPAMRDYPSVEAGIRGLAFVEGVVASSKSEQKWVKFPEC